MYRTGVEILTIGDEILLGQIVNTNASWLAARLHALGYSTRWMTTCSDRHEDIVRALRAAAERADIVVVTGGLGPTDDDRTVEAVTDLCATGRVRDQVAL